MLWQLKGTSLTDTAVRWVTGRNLYFTTRCVVKYLALSYLVCWDDIPSVFWLTEQNINMRGAESDLCWVHKMRAAFWTFYLMHQLVAVRCNLKGLSKCVQAFHIFTPLKTFEMTIPRCVIVAVCKKSYFQDVCYPSPCLFGCSKISYCWNAFFMLCSYLKWIVRQFRKYSYSLFLAKN